MPMTKSELTDFIYIFLMQILLPELNFGVFCLVDEVEQFDEDLRQASFMDSGKKKP